MLAMSFNLNCLQNITIFRFSSFKHHISILSTSSVTNWAEAWVCSICRGHHLGVIKIWRGMHLLADRTVALLHSLLSPSDTKHILVFWKCVENNFLLVQFYTAHFSVSVASIILLKKKSETIIHFHWVDHPAKMSKLASWSERWLRPTVTFTEL